MEWEDWEKDWEKMQEDESSHHRSRVNGKKEGTEAVFTVTLELIRTLLCILKTDHRSIIQLFFSANEPEIRQK